MGAYRKEKVASVVRQIVGEAIAYKLNDPRVDSLATVTRVEMSADLLIAKVYVVVTGSEVVERRTFRAIQHASGFLQRLVARGLQIRHCPTLQFELDRGVKGAYRTLELLAENLRCDPGLAVKDGESGDAARETDVDGPDPEGGSIEVS